MFFIILESVQQSLERRFGRVGGQIPIIPSAAFQERISVKYTFTFMHIKSNNRFARMNLKSLPCFYFVGCI